jgi:NADH dehydrogenase
MILVTGGTGVMGSALVRALAAQGHAIRVVTLPGDPHVGRIADVAADIRYGSIDDAAAMKGVCEKVSVVYHCAAVIIADSDETYTRINVHGTRLLAEEARASAVSQFVYVSSASVTYPRPTPYSLSKRAAENIVRATAPAYTIVRPTLVYDRGRGGLEFDMFLDYLRKFPVVPFIGNGESMKRPVYVEDIINGLVAVYKKKVAYKKIYNFSGGEAITMIAFARLCLRLLGRPFKPIVHIPVPVCMALAGGLQKMMRNPPLRWPVIAGITQDANLDPIDAIRDLGYAPARVREMLPKCFPRG